MTQFRVDLTTPERVARQLNTVNPDGTVPVAIANKASGQYANFFAYATDACRDASAYIQGETNRAFVPYRADLALSWDDIKYTIRKGRLSLNEDLLIPSEVAFGDLVIADTDYRVFPSTSLPIEALYLSNTAMTGASYDFGAEYTISGIWGYVSNLAQAWSVMQASLTIANDTVTEISVTVGTGTRYETLMYLKIDNEYMQITSIAVDTLTVLRGVNGTTAAAHTSVPLYRFNVEYDVMKAATELACYFYNRRNNVGQIQFPDGSVLLDTFPAIVGRVVKAYKRKVYQSVTGYPYGR
jgi:hypothetical protein